MSLAKGEARKERVAITSKANIDWTSPQNACHKLVEDLSGILGARLEEIQEESLVDVHAYIIQLGFWR